MSLALHTSPIALLLSGLRLRPTVQGQAPSVPVKRETIPHWTEYLSGRHEG